MMGTMRTVEGTEREAKEIQEAWVRRCRRWGTVMGESGWRGGHEVEHATARVRKMEDRLIRQEGELCSLRIERGVLPAQAGEPEKGDGIGDE